MAIDVGTGYGYPSYVPRYRGMSGRMHGDVMDSTPARNAASIETLPDMRIDHVDANPFDRSVRNPPRRFGGVDKMVPLTGE